MTKDDFTARYRAEMADVQVSPQLKRQTLDAIEGKEQPIVKKKLSAAFVLAVIIVLACAAALAAARSGILDFAGRYTHSYTPADAQDYVENTNLTLENDLVTVKLTELYYDGLVSRMTVDVIPKEPTTLLLGNDMLPEDNWQNMTHLNGGWDESDTRTALDVYREGGYQTMLSVDCHLKGTDGVYAGSGDYNWNEDGTLTLYQQVLFESMQPTQKAELVVSLFPFEITEEGDRLLVEEGMKLSAPLTLQQVAYENETYVSTEPADYPSIGVRVDEIRLEVRPQDIHYTIAYTVTDREKYNATDHGLWFEFIDPESTETDPWDQQLQSGMAGLGGAGPTDGKSMEEAVTFRQTDTLGRNELHETYFLRAYESWEKERFETCTFTMKKVEE